MAADLSSARRRVGGCRPAAILLLGALAGGVLAGCGDPGTPTAPAGASGAGTGSSVGPQVTRSSAGPGAPGAAGAADSAPGAGNATDVMFLQMMLEQHGQAAAVLRLAATRATRSDVRTLAAAIEATQRTESQTMTDWLRRWGRPLTADPRAHRAHDAHGGYDVLRGTTPADVDLLASTGPEDFDRTLLNILVAHQHNAVELARMQRAGGTHPGVTRFAALIDRSRTAQIEHLLTLLARPSPGIHIGIPGLGRRIERLAGRYEAVQTAQ